MAINEVTVTEDDEKNFIRETCVLEKKAIHEIKKTLYEANRYNTYNKDELKDNIKYFEMYLFTHRVMW